MFLNLCDLSPLVAVHRCAQGRKPEFPAVLLSWPLSQNPTEFVGINRMLLPPVSSGFMPEMSLSGICWPRLLLSHWTSTKLPQLFALYCTLKPHTHKHKARSVFPSSVCSKWRVTASPPPRSRAASFIFTKLEREMEKIKDGESSRQRWMDCEKRRLYSEIESYIKRNRGREKIRGLEGKSGETSIETGHIKWNRKWQWHTVMRWGNRLRVCVRVCVRWRKEGKEASFGSILVLWVRVKETGERRVKFLFFLTTSANDSQWNQNLPKPNSLFSSFLLLTQIAHSLLRLEKMTGWPAAAIINWYILGVFEAVRTNKMKDEWWSRHSYGHFFFLFSPDNITA